MNISIIKGDITNITVDAIVNAANTSLLGGGGVDGAIHRKGGPAILADCMAIRAKQGSCNTGEAVITTAGELQAKFVIHTVGPVWNADKTEKELLLKNCYTNSLKLATNYSLRSIAFPNISTGIYHFPKDKAVKIAFEAVNDFFMEHRTSAIEEVMFVCFDDENYALYNEFPAVFTTLYRPLYQPELSLIEQSNWLSFPPRLPEQPIFYPVTNEQYAIQIATEWNVPAYGVGHVVEFDLSNQFLSKYKVENVGGDIHNEYWIPSEELAEMNNNILGTIRLTKTFQK